MTATAIARPNIALAKYWGKRTVSGNVPATPSLSLTLDGDGLETRTQVTFDRGLEHDEFVLGARREGAELGRVVRVLDEVRALARIESKARVVSQNGFPTASGLASSASGFAALVVAALGAAGVQLSVEAQSRMARRASASAARSMLGGFVALADGDDPAAVAIAPADHWKVALVVGAVTLAEKSVGSSGGMEHCRTTSPYYPAWVADAPALFAEVRRAVLARDLEALGVAAEASALRMHACMMASQPALVYFAPATLSLLAEVRALRKAGTGAWATIDAGPHVKVLTLETDATTVAAALAPHVVRTIVGRPGEGARLL